jgi:proline dehydrogenase
LQAGIDAWTLKYMKIYNNRTPGQACVYGTYQAYLKRTPSVVASHLAIARKEGYTLGVKLVRGAYLGSDPRDVIHDTKADTDTCFDGIAEALMRRSYNDVLTPAAGEEAHPFQTTNVVLASHNHDSVRKAQAIRATQAANGEERIDVVYAQLQGMADEVSCDLLQMGKVEAEKGVKGDVPGAYKYIVWGTTGECMKYLLRRAQENKDAMGRTREGRDAMASEIVRRVKSYFGLA